MRSTFPSRLASRRRPTSVLVRRLHVGTRACGYWGPASGGGTYSIFGSGLSGVESITFGGVEAPNLYALNDESLEVWVPAHDPGEVRIVLHMPGAPDVDAGRYLYLDS